MYLITDEKAAIKEIQRLLFLNESGIYDDKTKNAVIKTQENKNLPTDGIVDFETFEAIVEAYTADKMKMDVKNSSVLKTNAFPYQLGAHNHDVTILNAMISNVIDKYSLPIWKPKGAFYSKTTASAVEVLREIFHIEKGRHIDEIFYDKLSTF